LKDLGFMHSCNQLAQDREIEPSNPISAVVGEPINQVLREHQEALADWDFSNDIRELHGRAEEMIFEFKLEVSIPCLTVETLRGAYGHFRHGRNGFGLRDEIAIDRFHLMGSPRWRVLETLLHELLHSWQEHHGKPGKGNYHTVAFREKARSLGLIVDEKGCTDSDLSAASPFAAFLEKHQVEVPTAAPVASPPVKPKPGSKLKLYACPCGVKVRVGRSRFNARCLDCGGLFVLKDSVRGGRASTEKPEAQ
jgi:hypothetical protein